MILLILWQTATRVGNPVLGVIIPASILFLSFIFTWMLYRHFSKHH